MEDHEIVISETLRRVYAREVAHNREPVYHRTPLDELVRKEEGEDDEEFRIRCEGADRQLEYFFEDGPDPAAVVRRVFAWAKARRADLLLNMTHHEIGLLLGETRAAGSYRVKRIVNSRLRAAGFHGTQLPGQKSQTACEKYASSAEGNSNRRKGHK
jgi:hypothetical protein